MSLIESIRQKFHKTQRVAMHGGKYELEYVNHRGCELTALSSVAGVNRVEGRHIRLRQEHEKLVAQHELPVRTVLAMSDEQVDKYLTSGRNTGQRQALTFFQHVIHDGASAIGDALRGHRIQARRMPVAEVPQFVRSAANPVIVVGSIREGKSLDLYGGHAFHARVNRITGALTSVAEPGRKISLQKGTTAMVVEFVKDKS